MADVHIAKADALYAEGERGLFGLFGGSKGKPREAAEAFAKAANFYKLAKSFDKAGQSYARAATASRNGGTSYEAASNLVKAASCYKKVNASEAAKALQSAIEIFIEDTKMNMAAKNQKDLAEIYESDNLDDKARQSYELAGDYYEMDGSVSNANGCYLKSAEIAAKMLDYPKAIEFFEKVAEASVGNKLLKWSVKDYLFKAGLCHLANDDTVATKKALDSYVTLSDEFRSTREFTLLESLVDAVENNNADAFSNAVAEYDSISRLDNWKTALLLEVKEKLELDDEPDYT